MAEQHGSMKLTRADVLVAVITCLLFIFVVPVLFARPREASVRRLCAANLAQIGKAMLVYADDNRDILPHAGGTWTIWGQLPAAAWMAKDRGVAFQLAVDGSGGRASISSSLYLLVKYYQMPPRVFVCKGDRGTTEWSLAYRLDVPAGFGLDDAWDFGPSDEAFRHCSYAYHLPFGPYGLTTSRDPNMAVAADRSPWIRSPAADATIWTTFMPDIPPYSESTKGGPQARALSARMGSSITHERDGQNVLFLDGRVTFQRRAYCGVEKDNIYTISQDTTGHGDPYGVLFTPGSFCIPTSRADSLLVHDPDVFPPAKKPSR